MAYGTSIGPMPDHIAAITYDIDFIELAIGEHEIKPTELDIQTVQNDLQDHEAGLVLHLPFRQPMATGVEIFNEAFNSYINQLLTSMAPFQAEKAVVHASCRDPEDMDERKRLEEQIRQIKKIGASHDVTICFENVGNFDGPQLHDLAAMLDDADAAMCFDTGHAFDEQGQEAMEDFVSTYADLIEHIHLQDTRPGQDLHLPLGAGDIDFEPVGDHLSSETASICLEIFTDDQTLMQDSMQRARRLF